MVAAGSDGGARVRRRKSCTTSERPEGHFGGFTGVRVDLQHLRSELEPIAAVHGVEVVSLEWALGPGRGILRVFIDRPGGDPRAPHDPARAGATANLLARVSRDCSAHLDTLDIIPLAYDLEVSSPGLERAVQLRRDYDRFAGLVVRLRTKAPVEGRTTLDAVIRGTRDGATEGDWVLEVDALGRAMDVPAAAITRARLAEIKAPTPPKRAASPAARRRNEPAPRPAAAVSAAGAARGDEGNDPR